MPAACPHMPSCLLGLMGAHNTDVWQLHNEAVDQSEVGQQAVVCALGGPDEHRL